MAKTGSLLYLDAVQLLLLLAVPAVGVSASRVVVVAKVGLGEGVHWVERGGVRVAALVRLLLGEWRWEVGWLELLAWTLETHRGESVVALVQEAVMVTEPEAK